MKLFSLHDMKARQWLPPALIDSEANAIRTLSDVINKSNPESNLAKYPEDFTLYCIGIWDQQTGLITAYKQPESIVILSTLKKA